jgi:hypothetical protein
VKNPRPSAWALVAVLVVGLLGSAGTVTVAAASQCTGWTDEFHPPTEIRVRRKSGPNAGTVEVVPFWNYVGTVLRAEYASSGTKGPLWMRIGALAVKEYAWYYTMHWRGGTVTLTNEDGTTTTQCYDVRDGTADQIYKPEKLVNGVWVPANVPTPANLQAMAETWPMSLRKWNQTKLKDRLFVTGYRSGQQNPCGTDSTGFKIFQKSLRDCGTKGLTFEETLRRYYEPNIRIVDPRERDILSDANAYFGDVGVLSPSSSSTAWRVYAGMDDGFADPVSGTFAIDPTKIAGQGLGDVTGDGYGDLVILTKAATNRLRLAVATGAAAPGPYYLDPTSQDLPAGAPTDQLLVGDFDGDLLADVGLLRSTPVAPLPEEPATLVVMRGVADGTFGAPQDWWRGALDLTPLHQQVLAGDVNGDGKADLVIRDRTAGVTFWVAPSFASCADFTAWGPCTLVPGTGLGVAAPWLDKPGWNADEVKWTLTDFSRDGRSDVVAVVEDGSGIDVFGAAATVPGAFGDAKLMWQSNTIAFADANPFGVDVNPDGLGDLGLSLKAGSNGANTTLMWLRATQTAGVVTFVSTTAYTDANVAWAAVRLY